MTRILPLAILAPIALAIAGVGVAASREAREVTERHVVTRIEPAAGGRLVVEAYRVTTPEHSRVCLRPVRTLRRSGRQREYAFRVCAKGVPGRRAIFGDAAYNCDTSEMEVVGSVSRDVRAVELTMHDGRIRRARVYRSPDALAFDGAFFAYIARDRDGQREGIRAMHPAEMRSLGASGEQLGVQRFEPTSARGWGCF